VQTKLIRELEKLGGQPVYEPVDRWQEVIPGKADTNLLVKTTHTTTITTTITTNKTSTTTNTNNTTATTNNHKSQRPQPIAMANRSLHAHHHHHHHHNHRCFLMSSFPAAPNAFKSCW
jgi:hypothetical protein